MGAPNSLNENMTRARLSVQSGRRVLRIADSPRSQLEVPAGPSVTLNLLRALREFRSVGKASLVFIAATGSTIVAVGNADGAHIIADDITRILYEGISQLLDEVV